MPVCARVSSVCVYCIDVDVSAKHTDSMTRWMRTNDRNLESEAQQRRSGKENGRPH